MKHNQIRQVVFPDPGRAHLGHCLRRAGRLRRHDRHIHVQRRALFHCRARAAGAHRSAECHAQGRPQPTEAEKRTGRKQLWLGGFCCGTALAIASNFQQAGIAAGTDAGKAGFLHGAVRGARAGVRPIFETQGQPAGGVAVALSVVSLYLLCIKGSFRLAAGDLLVLVCAVCFAVHILVIDHFGSGCDGVKLSCVQFLFAGLWSAVCIPFFEHVDAAALLRRCRCCMWAYSRVATRCRSSRRRTQPHGRHHPAESRERVRRHRGRDHPAPEHDPARIPRLRADVPRRRPSRRSRCRPRPPARK